MEDERFANSFPDGVLRIVLTEGPERALIPGLWESAARQPGQPLPSVIEFREAGRKGLGPSTH
jgi:hypothetical protein